MRSTSLVTRIFFAECVWPGFPAVDDVSFPVLTTGVLGSLLGGGTDRGEG